MTVTHLLDSDVVIDVLRGADYQGQQRLAELDRGVGVCDVTVMELTYGALRSRDPQANLRALDGFWPLVTTLPLDTAAARSAGRIRAELAADGTPIGSYDLLIAGVAVAAGLTLVTGNVREFAQVAGLTVEKWTR